jgi:hypothetical protein
MIFIKFYSINERNLIEIIRKFPNKNSYITCTKGNVVTCISDYRRGLDW